MAIVNVKQIELETTSMQPQPHAAIYLVSRSQTLSSQGAYRLEMISARSERVW